MINVFCVLHKQPKNNSINQSIEHATMPAIRYRERNRWVIGYFFDVSVGSAEERDRLVVDGRQCYGGQPSGREDHQWTGLQRDGSNERCVLLDFTTVAGVDLNALHTTSQTTHYHTMAAGFYLRTVSWLERQTNRRLSVPWINDSFVDKTSLCYE